MIALLRFKFCVISQTITLTSYHYINVNSSPASGHAIISCNTAALLAHSDVCSRLVPLKAKLENYKKRVHQVDAAILKQSEVSYFVVCAIILNVVYIKVFYI